MGWHTDDELRALGIRSLGKGVRVSTDAKLYRPELISIGDFSRIDDGSMLTPGPDGSITLGRNVYIGPCCIIESPEDATFGDFSTLAARVTIYGATDNYLGDYLTNPTVPADRRGLTTSPVKVGRHAIIGTHSVVLPGAHIGEGAAVGAMTLVNRSLEAFGVYVGTPARRIRDRSRRVLDLEASMYAD
jgi:acetyltransferase-like isoleucine patch superfamily enzyme